MIRTLRLFSLGIVLSSFLFGNVAWSQCPGCMVNAGCTVSPAAPTICPDTLPDGTAMQVYAEDISFYLPAEFVDDGTGFTVSLDQMTVLNVTGLPYGLNWETNAVNNIYYPSSNPPATEHGCARICGTPLMPGNYTVTVFVRAEVTVSGIGQTVDDNFTLPLRILAASSSNSNFSINNPMGCVPLITGFVNNLPSGGNSGYSYLWNFGNGNQSTLENPPAQNYLTAGSYTVSMQTTIDTIGYFLNSVSVLAATGCNDSPFSAPDYYFILKQGGTTLYTSGYIDNTDPPVTFSFTPISLSNVTYDLEIWEYDTGLAGDDDYCGTVSFNGHTAGTQTLTSGSLIASFTIDHPVLVINATDTIEVYPSPQVSAIVFLPNDSICAGDSIELMVQATGAMSYQWYRDTLAILNATDSIYYAKQSGTYYCEAMNSFGCRTLSNEKEIVVIPNPPKPTFWITGNTLNTNLGGYFLQWYFEGDPINGATGMVCAVTATGNYFLVATNNFGCTNVSDTVYVTYSGSGISELLGEDDISVYPNPGTGVFTMEMELHSMAVIQLIVCDLTGRRVFERDCGAKTGAVSEVFDLGFLGRGTYMLNMVIDGNSYPRRLIIL
jgi:hypothetical protein